jgi:integrase
MYSTSYMNTSAENNKSIWECVSSVKGLLRHVRTGRYYSRLQINGRREFVCLKTSTLTVAKLRQQERILQAERRRQMLQRMNDGEALVGDLIDKTLLEYAANQDYSASTKTNIKITVSRLVRCWRECFGTDIRSLKPTAIVEDDVRRFGNFLQSEAKWRLHLGGEWHRGYSAVGVNKTIELIHRLMRLAVKNGTLHQLPFELDPVEGGPIRKSVPRNKLRLPSSAKMEELFATMRLIPGNLPDMEPKLIEYLVTRSNESADLAEFMAYSGARISEARSFCWEDERPNSIILRGTKSVSSRDREVPKIPALRELLERMRRRRDEMGRALSGRAFRVGQCREALQTACQKVGIERLTHHSLRHFFATLCIESGVDIPTVSRWLGHSDGGVLAMRTYGHLRMEHSFAAAAKVTMRSV